MELPVLEMYGHTVHAWVAMKAEHLLSSFVHAHMIKVPIYASKFSFRNVSFLKLSNYESMHLKSDFCIRGG